MNWYVLITFPKNEFKVSNQLNKIGIISFCPFRKELRKWSDRFKKINIPLLPSMVLVYLKESDRNKVFDINGIKRYLYYLNKPAIVYKDEVEVLKNFENNSNIKIKKNNYINNQLEKIPGFEKYNGKIIKMNNNYIWIRFKQVDFNIKFELI